MSHADGHPTPTRLVDLPPDLLARIGREVHHARSADRRPLPHTATLMDIGGGMIRSDDSRSSQSFMATCTDAWNCPAGVAVHVCVTPELSDPECGEGCLNFEHNMGRLPPRAVITALHLYTMYTRHDMTEERAGSLREGMRRCCARLASVGHVNLTFPCCLPWVAAYAVPSLPALRSIRLENCGVTCPRLPGREVDRVSLPGISVLEIHMGLGRDAVANREEIRALVHAAPNLTRLRLLIYSNSPGLLAVHRRDEAQGDARGALHVDSSPLCGLALLRSLEIGRQGGGPDPELAENHPDSELALCVWMDRTPVVLHGLADVVGGCARLTHLRILTGQGCCVDLSDAEPDIPGFASSSLTHLWVDCLSRNIARSVDPPPGAAGAGPATGRHAMVSSPRPLLPALRDAAYRWAGDGVVPADGWREISPRPRARCKSGEESDDFLCP